MVHGVIYYVYVHVCTWRVTMYENRYYNNIQCTVCLNNYREISRDNIFSDIGSTVLLLKNVPQNIKKNNNVQTWPIRRATEVLLRVLSYIILSYSFIEYVN